MSYTFTLYRIHDTSQTATAIASTVHNTGTSTYDVALSGIDEQVAGARRFVLVVEVTSGTAGSFERIYSINVGIKN